MRILGYLPLRGPAELPLLGEDTVVFSLSSTTDDAPAQGWPRPLQQPLKPPEIDDHSLGSWVSGKVLNFLGRYLGSDF